MAQPRLRASFFVTPNGIVIPKAPPLKRSEAYLFYQASNKQCSICKSKVDFGGKFTDYLFKDARPGQVDHIIPRAKGGQNNKKNLQLLCLSCNMSKGAK